MNEILLKMLEECEHLPYIRLGRHVYIRKEVIKELIERYIKLDKNK